MNADQVTELARELMDAHGLEHWTIAMDRATKRAGVCYPQRELLSFSKVIMGAYSEAEVRNTILHEIAHAIVGIRHNHDFVWRQMFIAIGGNGAARTQATEAVQKAVGEQSKYRATCSGCGETYFAQRRKKSFGSSMCSEIACPTSWHKTRFTKNHVYLVWVESATNSPVPSPKERS
jgi:predicted SprT family Zn-dependent metalloprotease